MDLLPYSVLRTAYCVLIVQCTEHGVLVGVTQLSSAVRAPSLTHCPVPSSARFNPRPPSPGQPGFPSRLPPLPPSRETSTPILLSFLPNPQGAFHVPLREAVIERVHLSLSSYSFVLPFNCLCTECRGNSKVTVRTVRRLFAFVPGNLLPASGGALLNRSFSFESEVFLTNNATEC